MRTELERFFLASSHRLTWILQVAIAVLFCLILLLPSVSAGLFTTAEILYDSLHSEIHFSHWLAAESPVIRRFVRAKSTIRYHLFGLSPHRNFYLGENGMFERQRSRLKEMDAAIPTARPLYDLLGKDPYTVDELDHIARTLMAREKFLRSRGIPYLVVFIPRKSTVYPEIYPEHVRDRFDQTNLQRLYEYLERTTDLTMLNLSEQLLEKKHPLDTPLYYKTDAHWNMLGAFYGYQSVMEKVNHVLGKSSVVLTKNDFSITLRPGWCHKTFRRMTGLCLPDHRFIFKPILSSYAHIPVLQNGADNGFFQPLKYQRDYEQNNLILSEGIGSVGFPNNTFSTRQGERREYVHIKNFGSPEYSTAVFLTASFGEKMLYFFANHFRTILKTRETRGFQTHIFNLVEIEQSDIDIVIQTIPEGILHKKAAFWNPDNFP